jgi:GntR family transcriptional regulator, trigonelline degradation regulator
LRPDAISNTVLRYYDLVNLSMDSPPTSVLRRLAAPLRQQVLDTLRAAIIAGELTPGARLTERELTARLGVSRTVVREALRQLETEGLIEATHRGPVVRALTLDEAGDLYAIRAVLEGFAARLFAQRASDAEIEALHSTLRLVSDAYASGDAARVLAAKTDFYDTFFRGARSETLSTMLSTLHARISRWRALGLSHPARSARRSRDSLANLGAILEAVRARDGEAAERLTRAEAEHAAQEVMRLLAESQERSSAS